MMDKPLDEIASAALVFEVMSKYGSNEWWKSPDEIRVAAYQAFEEVLIANPRIVTSGLWSLLNKAIIQYEFVNETRERFQGAVEVALRRSGRKDLLFEILQYHPTHSAAADLK